jgi:cytochrome c peroxidase
MRRVSRIGMGSGQKHRGWPFIAAAMAVSLLGIGCEDGSEIATEAETATEVEVVVVEELPDPAVVALAERAAATFGVLPSSVPNPDNVGSPAKLDLGRMLYYDARLSKNHDIACNSCHLLDAHGVDGEPTSPGHRGARGGRNSPTVYNAAMHTAQFWDGREPDVEAQAKGPVLNPIEMAAPSEDHVVTVLASIPGYVDAFSAAFPDDPSSLNYDNMARAIGAFERNLMTPGRFDAFMAGELDALDATERRGLATFLEVGCNSCHTGPALGGALYRKLGFIFPYETQDLGREDVTGEEADRHVFKVPSLRNVAKTGPYFHDGSIVALDEVVRLMGYHQIGIQLDDAQVTDIVAFLGALTAEPDLDYVAKPELPESGPDTPKPDPS